MKAKEKGHVAVKLVWIGQNKDSGKQVASIEDSFNIQFVRDEDEYILTSNKYKLNVFVNKSEIDFVGFKESLKTIYLQCLIDYFCDIAEFVYYKKTSFGDSVAVRFLNKMIECASKYYYNKTEKTNGKVPEYDIFKSFELIPNFV